MSTNVANQSRRIATAIVAIAVTAMLHGGWLADVNGPRSVPTTAAVTA